MFYAVLISSKNHYPQLTIPIQSEWLSTPLSKASYFVTHIVSMFNVEDVITHHNCFLRQPFFDLDVESRLKAFKDNSSVKIGAVTYAFSGFTYGRTFTFDYVQGISEYYYQVADKNCTYILANLTISTNENYASEPRVYACEIVDGKLKNIDDNTRWLPRDLNHTQASPLSSL